jgi:DNA-directed RNA polymerase alpha subunit
VREELRPYLGNIPLDQVDLTTRARNCLINENISTVGQLADLTSTRIMRWRNAGQKTLRELRDVLGRFGLKLSDDPSRPPPADPQLLAELFLPPPKNEATPIFLKTADGDVQRVLLTRIKDLPFSTRAHNVLAEKGITFVGELVQLNFLRPFAT